jgi:regulator of sirC expression with transglutaminase-like and TPR domain
MDTEQIKAETLYNTGNTVEALEVLDLLLKSNPTDCESLMLRAKVFYRLQKWGAALNDLNLILDNEPENQTAINFKTMVLNIITYWNKDNFNP